MLLAHRVNFAVMQQFGRFRGEADIARTCCWLDPVPIDPKRTFRGRLGM